MKKIALLSLLAGMLLTGCNSGKNDLDHPAGQDGQTESAEEMRSNPDDGAEAGSQAAGSEEGQGTVLQDKPNNSADTSAKH
jgi:hypothetical protein